MQTERKVSDHLAYNLYLKDDLLRVAREFDARQIPFLLIKGISLAGPLYGGLAHRPMVDNDVVVQHGDAVRAHQALRELGFYDREGNVLALNLAADYQHPMHYRHPHVDTCLELHWHLYASELFLGALPPYLDRAVTFAVDGHTIKTLGSEDRLLHLVTHWAQHGLNKPSILRDIECAWNVQREGPNAQLLELELLVRRAKAIGAFPLLCLALLLLEQADRLQVVVPRHLRSQRADWFARVERRALQQVLSTPLEGAREHHLRVASWAMLHPRCALASAKRELIPSRARLSRIVGQPLTTQGAALALWRRQGGAVRKWFGP